MVFPVLVLPSFCFLVFLSFVRVQCAAVPVFVFFTKFRERNLGTVAHSLVGFVGWVLWGGFCGMGFVEWVCGMAVTAAKSSAS